MTGSEDGLDVIYCRDEPGGFSVVGVVEEEDFVLCGVGYSGCDALWDETWYDTLSTHVIFVEGRTW